LRETKDNKTLRLTEKYLKEDILFRRGIADIGGMARAVETFYSRFMRRMAKTMEIPDQDDDAALTKYLHNIDVVIVMQELGHELSELYPFGKYVDLMTPVLAKAILDIPVNMNENIEDGTHSMTYKDLRTTGVINLEYTGQSNKYHVRVPYLWLMILVQESNYKSGNSPLRFWKDFINPEQEVSWAAWERFNMEFLALRLCLFSYLGEQTVTLQDLFEGAEFGPGNFEVPELEVPDYRKVTVHQLLDTFPKHETAKDVDGMEHTNFLH
ncbi:hypothetical protein BGZ58_004286, partial [Dissophora ornata]